MRVTAGLGTASAIVHAGALLWPANVTPERARFASVVYLFALSVFWWALETNRRRPLSAIFSADVPTHLAHTGPYRFVRHPFYCSYLAVWTAGVVATAKWWLAPILVVMLILYIRAARFEERKFLASTLAERYRDYQARTGQLLPNPLKMLLARR